MQAALLVSIVSLCVSAMSAIVSYRAFRRTHVGHFTVDARAVAADQVLRVSVTNSGSRAVTLDGVVVGYGIGPASMQTMADLLEGQSEDVMLAVGQRVTWNMKLSRLRECAASRRVAQDYNCRLWARVKAAAGPTSDIEVYFDQELGPKDASSVAWAYITSDLVLGFPRQPELVSGKHHMK